MSLSGRDFLRKGSLLCLGLGILGDIPGWNKGDILAEIA